MRRQGGLSAADLARFDAALGKLRRVRALRATRARRRLERLLASRPSALRGDRPGKMRLISMHLAEWQIEAAKLVAEIRGGSYQEWIRTWVVAGVLAEARARGKSKG